MRMLASLIAEALLIPTAADADDLVPTGTLRAIFIAAAIARAGLVGVDMAPPRQR
jgi:hypothetical protein